VIFTTRGGFGVAGRSFAVNGEGEAEIDTVVDILFDHTDTDGKKTVARYIAGKLLTYFAQPGAKRPVDPALLPVIDAVVAASGFDTTWDIKELLRTMFVHDAFYDTAAAAPFDATTKKSVKWPVDFVVSTLRLLKMQPKGKYGIINGGNYRSLHDHLDNMGQHLFEPPSVFGWDWETAWLSTSTLMARYAFVRDIIAARYGTHRFRPEDLIDLDLTDPSAVVDGVTDVMGITDQLTAGERTVLINYLTDNGTTPAINLQDYDVRNTKLHGLFALVMQTAAYQVH
jgi:uncharacterized protein (DUF1800 family)